MSKVAPTMYGEAKNGVSLFHAIVSYMKDEDSAVDKTAEQELQQRLKKIEGEMKMMKEEHLKEMKNLSDAIKKQEKPEKVSAPSVKGS